MLSEIEASKDSKKRKKKKAEEVILPAWLQKMPTTKRAKAEAIRYAKEKGLPLPWLGENTTP